MIIKKHKNKNQYIFSDDYYIRDFTNHGIMPVDLNHAITDMDCKLFVENEFVNLAQKHQSIDSENLVHPNILIVSDGCNFKEKHKVLADLDKNTTIIAVNGALKKWELVGDKAEKKKAINYYVVNNPYQECLNFLPIHRYYPKCIASIRTNPEFLRSYLGLKYTYAPVENSAYSGLNHKVSWRVEDYRNPICAALDLAYKFKASKIALFCCDDSFEDDRPSAVQLENGLWCYPQQVLSRNIADAMCYWLRTKKTKVVEHCSGGKYNNATYINMEALVEYFKND